MLLNLLRLTEEINDILQKLNNTGSILEMYKQRFKTLQYLN